MKLNTINTFIKQYGLKNSHLSRIEIEELYALIQEVEPKQFDYSSDLSRYIVRNKLGYRYPHISGVVTMENSENQWSFKGGFPPKIYKIVCKILGLSSQGTRTRAVDFRSYASMS